MKRTKKRFLVVGLGMFGSKMSYFLEKLGCEVLALDANEELVQDLSTTLHNVMCADASNEKVLDSLSLEDINVAVVSIGDLESNILCTMLLKEKGVPKVVVKALNEMHGKMLEKLGADEVIYAERDMAKRVANNLVSDNIMDYVELINDITLTQVKVPDFLYGKNLVEADLRNTYGVNVVAVKRANNPKPVLKLDPTFTLQPDDEMIVVGDTEDVKRMGEEF